jgi:hypothetical protein
MQYPQTHETQKQETDSGNPLILAGEFVNIGDPGEPLDIDDGSFPEEGSLVGISVSGDFIGSAAHSIVITVVGDIGDDPAVLCTDVF